MQRLQFALLASLLPAASSPPEVQDVQTYAQTVERKCTRIAYFCSSGSPGQFNVQFGQPIWKGEYEHQLEQLAGKRIRFGKDFWTTLDTNVDLTIGGAAVPAGYYYLGLGRAEDSGDWLLVLYDPAELRAERPDAFVTSRYTHQGIEAPLEHERLQGARIDRLDVELVAGRELGRAELAIRWGRHQLSAQILAELEAPPAGHAPTQAAGRLEPGKKR